MMLIISMMGSLISTVVSSMYIPSTGGTIPQGESTQDFSNRQQKEVYASIAFRSTITSLGIGIICLLLSIYRGFMIDARNEAKYQRDIRIKPILKVTRSRVAPSKVAPIEVIVDDPKPQVKTTPNLIPLSAPSSSPPIQLIPDTLTNMIEYRPTPIVRNMHFPRGPVVLTPINGKFRYPPPYDRMNRR